MTTSVYKYRTLVGLVEYKVIEGEFGVDSTLHLQDTSCTHSGPKCEIEVIKNGDCYQYSKPLNSSAEEYYYFHSKEEAFWATKKEAYIEHLHISIDSIRNTINYYEKEIEKANEKLSGLEIKEVNYLTSFMAKVGMKCYVEHTDTCRIIGTILFEDGSNGFLTDSNYYYDDGDGYDGDRIILVNGKNDRLVTENGLSIFLTKADYENLKTNNLIKKLKKEIERYNNNTNNAVERLNAINHIIAIKDTLTLEQLMEMEEKAYSKK